MHLTCGLTFLTLSTCLKALAPPMTIELRRPSPLISFSHTEKIWLASSLPGATTTACSSQWNPPPPPDREQKQNKTNVCVTIYYMKNAKLRARKNLLLIAGCGHSIARYSPFFSKRKYYRSPACMWVFFPLSDDRWHIKISYQGNTRIRILAADTPGKV